MLSFLVGNVVFLTWTQYQAEPSVPSPSDIGFLGIYPFAVAAVISLARDDEGTWARSLWLDGALGAAGRRDGVGGGPEPGAVRIEGDLATVLVGAAFPVADLLLVGMICGLLAVRGLRGGSMWLWLAVGLAAFCVADAVYALRLVSDTYAVGTVLDGLWAVSLMIMALALWRPRATTGDRRHAPRRRSWPFPCSPR